MSDTTDEIRVRSSTLSRLRSRMTAAAADLLAPHTGVTPLERGWVLPIALVWFAGRAVNLALLALAYAASRLGHWPFGPDGAQATTFVNFLSGWDAARYGAIASWGYPLTLPMDDQGGVALNNWAFLPAFPFFERVLASATGVSWQLAGVLISVMASGAATVVLYALLRHVTTERAAWWAVVLFSLGPLSFVFVLGYAESLFLLCVFSALLLAVRRRYLLIAPVGILAAFTRPGALALALSLGILLLGRLLNRRRDPMPAAEIVALVASGLSIAIAGLMWPVIADAVTGVPGAYVQTEMAWWVPFLGEGHLIPFVPGIVMGWTWLGPLGVLLALALLAAVLWWIVSRPVRRLGLEVVGFALSYALFLFAVFLPTQSLARLLMPLAPLLAEERLSRTHRSRVWSLSISLVLQAVAVLLLWTLGNP